MALLQELINFVMVYGVPKLINLVDPIVANAISLKADVSQGWSEQDREDISTLYLKVRFPLKCLHVYFFLMEEYYTVNKGQKAHPIVIYTENRGNTLPVMYIKNKQ